MHGTVADHNYEEKTWQLTEQEERADGWRQGRSMQVEGHCDANR
jgi:hypothetical protein